MAQFRVEFILDEASGKYLAELYNPDNQQEMMVRTEALYPPPLLTGIRLEHSDEYRYRHVRLG